jgi:uncharacterized protein YjbI with pentapeptide repeats
MANPEHVKILKQGVEVWNKWREDNPEVEPVLDNVDLNHADLSFANLRDAILSNADLHDAKFIGTNLYNADLSHSDLSHSDLRDADLRGANLRGSNLFIANLEGSYLSFANFSDANLEDTNITFTNFDYTDLSGTNMENAIIYQTQFSFLDLSKTKNLDKLNPRGPSSIDFRTLMKSKNLPDKFLRDCGLPEQFIDNLPSLLNSLKPIQFHSVFISYSSQDEEFAQSLHADLRAKNVNCWFAPEDMKIGDKIRRKIDEMIHVHDKLLLVLSKNSVNSGWVEKEVETALENETTRKETVLFPIRLDDTVMNITTGWPADIKRARNIGDFKEWKDHDAYQKSFARLLKDLKQES